MNLTYDGMLNLGKQINKYETVYNNFKAEVAGMSAVKTQMKQLQDETAEYNALTQQLEAKVGDLVLKL